MLKGSSEGGFRTVWGVFEHVWDGTSYHNCRVRGRIFWEGTFTQIRPKTARERALRNGPSVAE